MLVTCVSSLLWKGITSGISKTLCFWTQRYWYGPLCEECFGNGLSPVNSLLSVSGVWVFLPQRSSPFLDAATEAGECQGWVCNWGSVYMCVCFSLFNQISKPNRTDFFGIVTEKLPMPFSNTNKRELSVTYFCISSYFYSVFADKDF